MQFGNCASGTHQELFQLVESSPWFRSTVRPIFSIISTFRIHPRKRYLQTVKRYKVQSQSKSISGNIILGVPSLWLIFQKSEMKRLRKHTGKPSLISGICCKKWNELEFKGKEKEQKVWSEKKSILSLSVRRERNGIDERVEEDKGINIASI